MLGTARLLTFAFRALVLLLTISILWLTVASSYNDALVYLAGPFISDDTSVKAIGVNLHFSDPGLSPVAIDGLTLHFGFILLMVLVLAAVGIDFIPRITWLVILATGAFLVHVIGVALLAKGLVWAASPTSPDNSGQLVLSMFAVFWGLIPPAVGGIWCFLYWLPKVRRDEAKKQKAQESLEPDPSSGAESAQFPPENG